MACSVHTKLYFAGKKYKLKIFAVIERNFKEIRNDSTETKS